MDVIELNHVNGAIDWAPAFNARTAKACRGLRHALESQAEAHVGSTKVTAVKSSLGVGHSLMGNHYGNECATIARAIGLPARDVLLANLAYDLTQAAGCSTFVVRTINGPLHGRTLDWDFPRGWSRRLTSVYSITGAPAGDYTLIGWPGLFGAFTAIAPARFSVTINYVTHVDHGPMTAVANAIAGHWPAPWAVRRALDNADDFDEAVDILSHDPLISPVLFTVTGTKNSERVVIERSPDHYAHRRPQGRSPLITANVYQHDDFLRKNETMACGGCDGHGELLDDSTCEDCEGSGAQFVNDSVDRIEHLHEVLTDDPATTPDEALEHLDDGSGLITYANTQHAVAMCANTGELSVQVPGKRVIEVQL